MVKTLDCDSSYLGSIPSCHPNICVYSLTVEYLQVERIWCNSRMDVCTYISLLVERRREQTGPGSIPGACTKICGYGIRVVPRFSTPMKTSSNLAIRSKLNLDSNQTFLVQLEAFSNRVIVAA